MTQSNGDYFEGCHGPNDEEKHQRGDMNEDRILFGQTSYIFAEMIGEVLHS